ncbi:calcipressin-2-like [Amphiura filiformis]|uniref:calcipressin-2-like n=1 Tax=Amphiura filiformis TaxID=82378 RepID=UPI003B223543
MDSNSTEDVSMKEENGNHEASIEERLANMAVDNNTDEDASETASGSGSRTERKELPKLTRQSTGDFDYSELPRSLIATNVDDDVFMDESIKKSFQELCSSYGGNAVFYFLRGFKRIRIDYETPEQAVRARIGLHQKEINGKPVSFYFLDITNLFKDGNKTLQPPQPQKQFLLSPPSSPPVGWEPAKEAQPMINYDVLAALANLAPGEEHELHPAEGRKPSITVVPCEDPPPKPSKTKIVQTKRPEAAT